MQKLFDKFKIDSLIKYGVAAILIAVPLYPKFPLLTIPGVYVAIRVEDFLILIVTILWAMRNISNLKKLWENKIIRAIVLFLVAGLLATVSGIFFLNTATGIVGILEWGRRVEYLIGFVIALTSVRSIKDVEFYVKCIGIVLFLVFIFGVGQKYFNFPVITTQNQEYSKGIALRYVQGGHLASTFAGHYDLASYILLTSPIFIGLLFVVRKNFQKVVILFILVVSFWLMVNAASRITVVAYAMALSTTLIILRKTKYIIVVFVVTLVFSFATGSLFDRYLNIFNAIKDRLSDIIVPPVYAQGSVLSAEAPVQDLSTAIRLNVEWPRAIRAFMKNPLLGTGYSSTTLATDNDYLRILGETGILGFVSIFFVYFRIIKDFFVRAWPKKLFAPKQINFKTAFLAGIIGAIPGVLLNAVFIDVFEASKFAIPFWILLGLGIATLSLRDEKNY